MQRMKLVQCELAFDSRFQQIACTSTLRSLYRLLVINPGLSKALPSTCVSL